MSGEGKVTGQVVDLLEEYGDEAVGALLADSVFAHFPYVRTLAAGINIVRGAQDWLLRRKVREFLAPIDRLSQDQRRGIVEKLRTNERFRRNTGVQLIEILDRVESHRKPRMAGEAFAALAEGSIDLHVLLRLLAAIERLPMHEIGTVRRFVERASNREKGRAIEQESINALLLAGFVEISSPGPVATPLSYLSYAHTKTAEVFVRLNLDHLTEDGTQIPEA